ncbi:AAA family ATPase [Arthrobacter gandavensis]|uniref:AAA family ATPase n=1 Tax=Arthrobacter gandavensis TaxID=169960 RepID=UPI00189028B7|nr:AAA family ATPase [Arthrobacter gandavensis]MBF4993022.1 AAA family ATPase [Arthrobacter gandavensis]
MRVAPPPPLCREHAAVRAQPRLAGRSEELSAAVSAIKSNGGAVIVGPAGIGKTALANAAATATRQDFHIVYVRGTSFSAGTAYGALAWVLSEMPETPLDNPVHVLRALQEHLAARAGGRRTLLVVDNLHELDALSQNALVQLTRQSAAAMLATTPDVLSCGEELVRLWSEGMIRRIDLSPLDPKNSVALMEGITGGRLSALAAHAVWRQARGNPLFATLLCRDQMNAGRLRERSGVWTLAGPLSFSGEISDWLGTWYRRLSVPEQLIVDLVSLCPGIPLRALLDVADAQSVEALEERGVLTVSYGEGSVSLRDPLYARLVAERVPIGHFFELWQELRAAGLDPETWPDRPARAYALWAAAAGSPVGAEFAARACAAANCDGEPTAALRIAEAVQAPGPHPRLQLQRARALRALHEMESALAELEQLLELDDPSITVPALLELAMVARAVPSPRVSPPEALELAEAAAQLRPDPERTECLQQVTAARAALAAIESDPTLAPRDLGTLCLDWAVPAAVQLPARASRCQLLALEGRTQEALLEAGELWASLKDSRGLPLAAGAETLNGILCTYIMCAEPLRALEMLEHARKVRYLETHLSAWSELPAGVLHALCGRSDAALDCLIPAHRQLEVDDRGELLPLALAAMGYCYAERGDWERMSECLAAVPDFKAAPASHVLTATRYFQRAAALRFSPGAEPSAELASQGRRAADRGNYPAAVLCLSAAALSGDASAAAMLKTTAAAGHGTSARMWQTLGAGLVEKTPQDLYDAADALLARGFYLHGYRAALAAQDAAETANQRELGRQARMVANECYRMLADANSLESRLETLSDFERDLAHRAASGASSARLGTELHLSPRTVDWHLGRIFLKLHVSGRAELRRLLGDGGGRRNRQQSQYSK